MKKFILNNDVIIFDDGVLFLRQSSGGQYQFDHLLGNRKLTAKAVNNFKLNIEHNERYCSYNNIPYKHVIFPAKAIAYRKRLRAAGLNVNTIYNEELHGNANVFYPSLDSLDESCFFKDDTHCSFKGMHLILSEVLNKLDIDINVFDFELYRMKRLGDLSVHLNRPAIEVDALKRFINIEPHIHSYSIRPALKGNSGDFSFHVNLNAPIRKRLLLFGDSFFVGCISWLTHLFEEIVYVRCPFIIQEIASVLKPDIILTGNAERYLVNVPNIYSSSPFFMNYFNRDFSPSKVSEVTFSAFSALFSGRTSDHYLGWKKSLNPEALLEIMNDEELVSFAKSYPNVVDFLRDKAISIESQDIGLAYKYMSLANKARPSGPYIKNKLIEYKEILQGT